MKRQAVLIVALTFVIVGLSLFDVFMGRLQTREVYRDSEQSYRAGEHLLRSGQPAQAVELLQKAYTAERSNMRYQLSLADALLNSGQLDQASALLNDAASDAPNDGRVNLLLARLARVQNRPADESPFYHRAIYGIWRDNAQARRNQVRLEWIRRLVQRGETKLLLGELLPLETDTKDLQILYEVAEDYLIAESPVRSATLYRKLLAIQPANVSLQIGLADAETAAGSYSSAQTSLLRALHAEPTDNSVRAKMELLSALVALDPTPRRLPSSEKYSRSARLLTLVRDALSACGSSSPDTALAVKRPDMSNESAERLLETAERLWKGRPHDCVMPEAVSILMRKLSQA